VGGAGRERRLRVVVMARGGGGGRAGPARVGAGGRRGARALAGESDSAPARIGYRLSPRIGYYRARPAAAEARRWGALSGAAGGWPWCPSQVQGGELAVAALVARSHATLRAAMVEEILAAGGSGESLMRVHWVAVPKVLRARRANNRRSRRRPQKSRPVRGGVRPGGQVRARLHSTQSILTEIYLCHGGSDHEVEDGGWLGYQVSRRAVGGTSARAEEAEARRAGARLHARLGASAPHAAAVPSPWHESPCALLARRARNTLGTATQCLMLRSLDWLAQIRLTCVIEQRLTRSVV
jgi:hypothetical protein